MSVCFGEAVDKVTLGEVEFKTLCAGLHVCTDLLAHAERFMTADA